MRRQEQILIDIVVGLIVAGTLAILLGIVLTIVGCSGVIRGGGPPPCRPAPSLAAPVAGTGGPNHSGCSP